MSLNSIYIAARAAVVSAFLFMNCLSATSQDTEPLPKINKGMFYAELGGVYYHFRDEGASVLAYKGFGGGHVGMGYRSSINKSKFHEIDFSYEYGELNHSLNTENTTTKVQRLHGSYKLNWIKHKLDKRLSYLFGPNVSSDIVYLIYPYEVANNYDAYSFDLLALGTQAGIIWRFDHTNLRVMTELNLVGMNLRPQAYDGVSVEKFFEEKMFTFLFNNFNFSTSATLNTKLKRGNPVSLLYTWAIQRNNSTINQLILSPHNLTLRYFFNFKK